MHLNQLVISSPARHEEHSIVVEVEHHISMIEELETTVGANLQRATRLRQATFAWPRKKTE